MLHFGHVILYLLLIGHKTCMDIYRQVIHNVEMLNISNNMVAKFIIIPIIYIIHTYAFHTYLVPK